MNKIIILFLGLVIFLSGCGGEKFSLPQQPEQLPNQSVVTDTTYIQIQPDWDNQNGYSFNQPQDILLGREPLIYVADTGNDRILMMDLGGNLIGESQTIENPIAITQDPKLNLLIVNNTNKIFRINLIDNNHQIANAPVEMVYEEDDNPDRRYTGITAILGTNQGNTIVNYYLTATGTDKKDNQVLIFPEKFDVRFPNALALEPNGLGILSASLPSGITGLRDFNTDFIYCMIGDNSFKVQWLTATDFGFAIRLNPAQGNFDLLQPGKFSEPEDVTVDLEGNIYVIDADSDRLFKFSALGKELQSFGESGSGQNQFSNPNGVAFFNKTVYVADTGNNRIVRFKLSTDVNQ
jgi:hypothetical protein